MPDSVELLSLADLGCNEELPETGSTLEENSYQKANYILKQYKTDCFADDTGLEVDGLQGRPGVYSARYAGLPANPQKNLKKLLEEMSMIENRMARFRTIITLLLKESTMVFEGSVEGSIIREPRGSHGFGYDPVFKPNDFDLTFAEMTSEQKNKISHRGIAIRKLTDFLSNSL